MRRNAWMLLLCVGGLLGAVTVGVAPPAQACLADSFYTQTFKVTMSPEQTEYVLDQTAVIHVHVVRPADKDPLGEGVDVPAGQVGPASGIQVSVSLKLPKGRAFNWGVTDQNGDATVNIALPSTRLSPGWADASAYAYANYPLGCTELNEYGQLEMTHFVDVAAPGSPT
jgi:hypothetical protein